MAVGRAVKVLDGSATGRGRWPRRPPRGEPVDQSPGHPERLGESRRAARSADARPGEQPQPAGGARTGRQPCPVGITPRLGARARASSSATAVNPPRSVRSRQSDQACCCSGVGPRAVALMRTSRRTRCGSRRMISRATTAPREWPHRAKRRGASARTLAAISATESSRSIRQGQGRTRSSSAGDTSSHSAPLPSIPLSSTSGSRPRATAAGSGPILCRAGLSWAALSWAAVSWAAIRSPRTGPEDRASTRTPDVATSAPRVRVSPRTAILVTGPGTPALCAAHPSAAATR